MFNIFGALGALGRFLPGYIQGREQAISSNWNDMNQYNQVQAGQLTNAFHELTFPLDYNRSIDNASMSRDRAQLSQLGLAQEMSLFPMRMAVGAQQAQNTLSGNMNPNGGGQGSVTLDDILRNQYGLNDEQIAEYKRNQGLGMLEQSRIYARGGQQAAPTAAPTESNIPTAIGR